MAFKIIWAKEAENTFDAVISYLEENCAKKDIVKFIEETERTLSILQQNPFLFRGSEKENIFEVLIGKQNLLLYQINTKQKRVELLSFWNARQNPKQKFNK